MNDSNSDGPLLLTTARFVNRHWLDDDSWSKVLAHTGSYSQFAYGTDTRSWWRTGEVRVKYDKNGKNPRRYWDGPLQTCIVCSPWSGVIAADIDHMDAWPGSVLGRHLDPERDAISAWDSGSGPHCHILIDMRDVPLDQWPVQGPAEWGDVKSHGFVPMPGSVHYSGCLYAATANWGRS